MASPVLSLRIDRSKEIPYQEAIMAVAKIIEITATSEQSFEDGSVNGYRVDLKVSFVLN